MTTIQAAGVLLTADEDTRVLTYRLLPYGEQGRTNVGMITASKGCITWPDDASSLVLNLEHVRTSPLGRGVSVSEDEAGLAAAFRVARTRAGDDLIAEAAEGLRTGISVEIDDPVIRDGALVAGALVGAGAVTAPAFASAVLVASDVGEPPPEPEPAPEDDEDVDPEADAAADETDEGETEMPNALAAAAAAAPADLRASATQRGPEIKTARDFARLLASASSTRDPVLLAALSDITSSGLGADVADRQWLDELWSGRAFLRQVIPLLGHADLTAMKVDGWRWVTKPEVDDYTGNKTAVPSNAADTEPQSVPASRLAGAHDIDRAFIDFPNEAFWASYNRAMIESYARKSDAKATADILGAATAVSAGTVPAGVSAGMAAIVDGALAIIPVAIPSFAIVGSDLYRDVLLTRSDDTLAYLNAALGLEDGTVGSFKVIPSAATALAGKVLVGAREAATVHEVPGSPIRAEAIDISKGGIDVGFFGYLATVIHDDEALALVS